MPKKVWCLSDLRITFETNNNYLLDFYPGNIQFWMIFCHPSGIQFKKWKQNSLKYTKCKKSVQLKKNFKQKLSTTLAGKKNRELI